ncbi:MAG: hypothetical protein C4308_14630, partial [Chitinophagaceae bacterium]
GAARDARAEGEPAPAGKPEGDKPDGAPAETKTPEALAEERRMRIEQRKRELAEEERARVAAAQARKAWRQQPQTPPEQPPKQGVTITDAASFFEAAEKLQIPPQDLAAWLMQQQDPAKAAEFAAKKTLTPIEQKLAELEAKQRAWEDYQRQLVEQAQVSQIVEQNHRALANLLESQKAEAPLSAAFMANSPAEYRRAVESICDGLPPGFTAQDVIDQLEENLSSLAKALQIQAASTPSTAKPSPKYAAAKANVGNRLASERATTVNDDGEDEGDLEERARKLKARLAAG